MADRGLAQVQARGRSFAHEVKATVRLAAEAEDQAAEAQAWWVANRPLAPGLFANELLAAIDLLTHMPRVGQRYRVRGVPGLRRMLLPRTRYHVYYTHDPEARLVVVVAVWGAVRGHGPPLRRRRHRGPRKRPG